MARRCKVTLIRHLRLLSACCVARTPSGARQRCSRKNLQLIHRFSHRDFPCSARPRADSDGAGRKKSAPTAVVGAVNDKFSAAPAMALAVVERVCGRRGMDELLPFLRDGMIHHEQYDSLAPLSVSMKVESRHTRKSRDVVLEFQDGALKEARCNCPRRFVSFALGVLLVAVVFRLALTAPSVGGIPTRAHGDRKCVHIAVALLWIWRYQNAEVCGGDENAKVDRRRGSSILRRRFLPGPVCRRRARENSPHHAT